MKFNAIISLCKKSKQILLLNAKDGCQWISDGFAIYPLYGFPYLTMDNIFTVMNIPEENVGKFLFREQNLPEDVYNFSDSDATENQINNNKIEIMASGLLMEPLETQSGIYMIRKKHLAPFGDLKNGVQYFERVAKNGTIYVVAKSGFLLQGVILPTTETLNEAFSIELSRVAILTAEYVQKKAEGEPKQRSMFDEGEGNDDEL